MDKVVVVAIVSVAGSILVAALTFWLNAFQKRRDDLRQRKVERYQELLVAISDLAVRGTDEETNARYATAVNTIGLTAPQFVIEALLAFQDEISVANQRPSKERHDALLSRLVLEMRRSLELPLDDDPATFRFRLVGGRRDHDSA
jgi:hypothetical protein